MLMKNLKYWKSDLIQAGCPPNVLKDKISWFYKNQYGIRDHRIDMEVTLECELNDESLTSDCSHVNVTTHIYTIKLLASIDGPSQVIV